MGTVLRASLGQYSDKGRKEINQEFHGVYVPREPQLTSKGIAVALADGISSSAVGQVASESAVKGFLEDYYCTSDAWTVKTSAHRVLTATNSWLYSQTRHSRYRYDRDRGYVCTFSALVIKSTTAHLFHIGDARIYLLRDGAPEQLTNDHRVAISAEQNYLARALGLDQRLDLDYLAVPVAEGDVFVLLTDGVHEHLEAPALNRILEAHGGDLELAARRIGEAAHAAGSPDNLTVQLVRIDELPIQGAGEIQQQLSELPLPPLLQPRMSFDGYQIEREIHASSRSHIHLARDLESGDLVALKTPSVDLREDPAYLERFMLEEWVARRINSAHVLRSCPPTRRRNYLYVVMEYLEGQTLAQWMRDHPRPGLPEVRQIVEQIAKGLRAFHRQEMLHQDLRPENIMIERSGTVKIIDFGSTRVAGLAELASPVERAHILGTFQYTAPEYFVGDAGSASSDLFSLGVITYQMLTGFLPYGTEVARIRTRAAQRRLSYRSALTDDRELPAWIDEALRKAVHPLPEKRQEALSEFVADLQRPSSDFLGRGRPALIERHPVGFWKALALALFVVVIALIGYIRATR